MDNFGLTGNSYDNTGDLGATTWRHVAFVERIADAGGAAPHQPAAVPEQLADAERRLQALRATPAAWKPARPARSSAPSSTRSCIQQDICNGCGYCLPACPFGVPALSAIDHQAHKCTLCYDRLKDGLEPACAKACPTDSIQFGPVDELLRARPGTRRRPPRARRRATPTSTATAADGGTGGIDGLNAFFILTAPPEVYNLPSQPELPQRKVLPAFLHHRGHGHRAGRGGGARRCGDAREPAIPSAPVMAAAADRPQDVARHTERPLGAAAGRGRSAGRLGDENELLRRAGDPQAALEVARSSPTSSSAASPAAATCVATIAELVGGAGGRPIARAGRYISFAALLPCPLLLILDLGRPERFLHMLRVFKLRSPMSVGIWGLTSSAASAPFRPASRPPTTGCSRRAPCSGASSVPIPARLVGAGRDRPAFFVGGYTGVLLAATAVPLWTRNHLLLGPLFLTSALSSATAAIALVLALLRGTPRESLKRLERFDALALLAELVLVLAVRLLPGPVIGRALTEGRRGPAYLFGVIGLGILAPAFLQWPSLAHDEAPSRPRAILASILVLIGGFLLRYVMVFGGRHSADDPAATFTLAAGPDPTTRPADQATRYPDRPEDKPSVSAAP